MEHHLLILDISIAPLKVHY